MSRLSGVTCCFPSVVGTRGRRTGCYFLDFGDGVGLAQEGASIGCDFRSGETLV
jgi:hypothetical protein